MANPSATTFEIRSLTQAWGLLIALSLSSAALTALALPPKVVGGVILLLALVKSRIILARYLDLMHAPGWLRGFTLSVTLFTLVLFGLSLI